MSSKPAMESDAALVAALLELLDARGRHRVLVDLSARLTGNVLVAAGEAGWLTFPMPFDEDGVVRSDLGDRFLQEVRPPHDAHDYLDDQWNYIWEDAWPEGVAEAILGSVEFDGYAAAELMEAIERKAEDIGLPEPPWFDTNGLVSFVRQWRSRALAELSRLSSLQ